MNYDNREALSLIVSFDQPLSIADGKERKEWWLKSKRLGPEVLVCLVDSQGSILFCTVSQNSKPKGGGEAHPMRKIRRLSYCLSSFMVTSNKLASLCMSLLPRNLHFDL
jgi:hypothetical protein